MLIVFYSIKVELVESIVCVELVGMHLWKEEDQRKRKENEKTEEKIYYFTALAIASRQAKEDFTSDLLSIPH